MVEDRSKKDIADSYLNKKRRLNEEILDKAYQEARKRKKKGERDVDVIKVLVDWGIFKEHEAPLHRKQITQKIADEKATAMRAPRTAKKGKLEDKVDDSEIDVMSHASDRPVFDEKRYTDLNFEIGRGAMGIIKKFKDTRFDRECAVKILPGNQLTDQRIKRVQREVKLTGRKEHQQVVRAYDYGFKGENLYFVMEFVRGRPFTSRVKALKEGRISTNILPYMLSLVASAADGLQIVHDEDIIHRDIKPDNMMIVDDEEYVKMMDFGLAKKIGDPEIVTESTDDVERADVSRTNIFLTDEGTMMGTPIYMSPEQADADPDIDNRTDIWALGCVLYEILVGEPPFMGQTPLHVIAKILDKPVIPPSKRRKRNFDVIPPALDAICMKALAKKRKKRYEHAQYMAEDLRNFLDNEPVSVYTEKFGERLARSLRKNPGKVKAYFATAGLALLLAIGAPSSIAVINHLSAKSSAAESKAKDAVIKKKEAEKKAALKDKILATERADREEERADDLETLAKKEKERRQAIEWKEKRADAIQIFSLADIAFRNANYKRALDLYNQTVAQDDTFVDGYSGRAVIQLMLAKTTNDRQEASRYLLAAKKDIDFVVSEQPQDGIAHNTKGHIYLLLGRTEEAQNAFTEAILLAPKQAKFIFDRAIFYSKERQFDKALLDYNEAIRLAPSEGQYLASASELYRAFGNLESAEKLALRAIKHGFLDGFSSLGFAYASILKRIQNSQEREEYKKKAIQSFENYLAWGSGALDARVKSELKKIK